jgi:hypothetical protein
MLFLGGKQQKKKKDKNKGNEISASGGSASPCVRGG